MKSSEVISKPSFLNRIGSVWYRHMRVYSKNLITNGFPPFLEPIIFLFAIGLGLGKYITEMGGIPYIEFLASGLLVTSSMFTAAFECSYGTFIRLEFDKAYDGMMSAPITVRDLLMGEILWAGTKGLFFSSAVLTVVCVFGILPLKMFLFVPFAGFVTGLMFASLSLFVTSFVKNINQFNFYMTGFISPMFFFSGVVFSQDNMKPFMRLISEILPLTHSVRLVRACCITGFTTVNLFDAAYMILFTVFFGYLAIRRLRKRLVD